jgi:lipopolysaccharide export LptBFGC system permease protein LptF
MERENISLKQKLMNQDKIQRDFKEENDILRKKLKELELKYSLESSLWESERAKWSEEQNRVLRYQKALQHNYVITCQKAQDLSYQVESLTSRQRFTHPNNEDHKN